MCSSTAGRWRTADSTTRCIEGYHTSLMKGRYPVCCLFLEIDPAAVDVNIHPAKREVKFHRESEVRKLVAQADQGNVAGVSHANRQSPEVQRSDAKRRAEPSKPSEDRSQSSRAGTFNASAAAISRNR